MKDSTIIGGMFFFWIIGVLISLGFTGVIIWAIIKFVHHFLP